MKRERFYCHLQVLDGGHVILHIIMIKQGAFFFPPPDKFKDVG